MSGSYSRKKKRKTMRQRSKEEIRWYMKSFADIIDDKHENMLNSNSEYTLLTSEQLLRLAQGLSIRRT
ncbi:MAG: hypothetical protein RTV31_04530 [Candidatus Thorarchaeota archaeon]